MLEPRRIVLLTMVMGVCILQLAGATAPAAAQAAVPTPLAGTITAPTGEPMPGVTVSVRAESKPITTSVFTDEAGQYYFPPLAPPLEGGRYRVWAQAVGYETASADVVLDPGATGGSELHPGGRRRLHAPTVGRRVVGRPASRDARGSPAQSWDFRFACPRWPLYTPEGRPAPETLVRHSIVTLQRPSAQPVVTCGRLEALCSRHFSDTAPHVGHFVANRTALPVPRVSLPAPAAPRSAATCRRTAAGLDVLPPAGASSTWHASRAGPRSSPAAAGDS